MKYPLRPRPSTIQPLAVGAYNPAKPFARPGPRGEAVKRFIFGKPEPTLKPHSWRAPAFEQQLAAPAHLRTPGTVTPGTISSVAPGKAWQKTSRGYRKFRPLYTPETQGGRMARESCVAAAGFLGGASGARFGVVGGGIGTVLGTALGAWGCDSAGNLMVPYVEPGLPNKSPRVDLMGNTISPHL